MAQIKLAEYTFDNSVGDCLPTLTPNTITMTTEDSVSDTTTRRIVYIDDTTMPTRIMFSVREPLLTVDYLNIDSNITSMKQLFHNAQSLTYINVDNWNTSNVTDLYQCFFMTTALTQNIDFTKMNLSKVTGWHHAFAYSSLPRIDLSHISPTLSSTDKEFFGYCKAEYVDISGWTFTNTMSQLFNNATQLKTVVLNNVTTTGVTNMGTMFRNCYNLKTINVSSFDTSSVTTFADMFNNCGIATKIKGIENFDVSSATNFASMFYKCSSLTKLDLRNWVTSSATSFQGMFNGCTNLEVLRVDNFDYKEKDTSGLVLNSMFENCTKLKQIFLPKLTNKGLGNFNRFCSNCSRLEYISMPNFVWGNCTSIDGAFSNCTSLKMLDLTTLDSSTFYNKAYGIGGIIENITCPVYYNSNMCSSSDFTDISSKTNLIDVQGRLMAVYDFSNEVTGADVYPTLTGSTVTKTIDTVGSESYITHRVIGVDVMPTAISFQSVTGLLNVDYLAVTSSCTSLEKLFYNCNRLENINTFGWDVSNVTNMVSAFHAVRAKQIDMSGWNFGNNSVDTGFMFCGSSLEELVFPTMKFGTFWSTFDGCTSLKKLDLSKVDTSEVQPTGMSFAFRSCPLLSELDLSMLKLSQMGTSTNQTFEGWTSDQIVYVHDTDFQLDVSSYNATFVRRLSTLLARYTFDNSVSDCLPKFNNTILPSSPNYKISDMVNGTVTTRLISVDDEALLPTRIHFSDDGYSAGRSILTCDYLDISNCTSLHLLFYGCNKLTYVNTSSWNTSKVETFEYAFRGTQITTLDTTNIDVSNAINLRGMFDSCSRITSLDLSSWNVSKTRTLNLLFKGCYSLTSLDISTWDTSNVDNMGAMFDSVGITELDLSHFITSKVTNMSNMFSGCKIQKLDLSSWDVSKVDNVGLMFYSNAIKEINVDGWNTENFTNMYGMFCSCGISKIDVSHFKTSKVTNMSQLFDRCYSLTSVGDLSNWDTSSVTNMARAFDGCAKLTELNVAGWDTRKVTSFSGMFNNWTSAQTVYYEPPFWSIGTTTLNSNINWLINVTRNNGYWLDMTGITGDTTITLANENNLPTEEILTDWGDGTQNSELTHTYSTAGEYVVVSNLQNGKASGNLKDYITKMVVYYASTPGNMCFNYNKITEVTLTNNWAEKTIEKYGQKVSITQMFRNCPLLELPNLEPIKQFKPTYCVGMFYNCQKFTSMDLTGWDLSNCTSMELMFSGCTSLTEIRGIESLNVSKCTSFDSLFLNCSSLTSLDISSWDISSATNVGGMFNSCGNLIELKLMKSELNNVTNVGSMFRKCSSLTSIDLSSLNLSKATTTQYMFMDCTSLTDIRFNDLSFSNISNCADMFSNCMALTNIDLSSIHITKNIKMNHMFSNCPKLQSIKMFNCDGNVETIHYAFNGCKVLKTLDLSNLTIAPNTSVAGMFWSCKELEMIDLSNIRDIGDSGGVFTECPKLTTLGLLYSTSNTINTLASKMPSTEQKTIYYYDADPSQLTPVEGVKFKKYQNPTTIQLPPHIQLHSLPDGTRDEVDIKTGILTRNVECYDMIKVSEDGTRTYYMLDEEFIEKVEPVIIDSVNGSITMSEFLNGDGDISTNVDYVTDDEGMITQAMFVANGHDKEDEYFIMKTTGNGNVLDTFTKATDCTVTYQEGNGFLVKSKTGVRNNVIRIENMNFEVGKTYNFKLELTTQTTNYQSVSNFRTVSNTSNIQYTNIFTNSSLNTDGTLILEGQYTHTKSDYTVLSMSFKVALNKDGGFLGGISPSYFVKVTVSEHSGDVPYLKLSYPNITLNKVLNCADELNLLTGEITRKVGVRPSKPTEKYTQLPLVEPSSYTTYKKEKLIAKLTTPTTEQLILNYNNSCDYGRILPTGMCDKYDVVNSMYTQTMTSILLDGENTWDAMEEMTNVVKFTATGTTVGVEELNMLGAGGLYCDNDLFPNINDDSDVEHCRVDEAGNKFYIYISKDRLMSPDLIGYQIWLQENNFNLIYELAEHLIYVKPYEELDVTQARWQGMDCMRDGAINYHTNSSDNITMYPTLEYVAPSINNFEVTMLEPNTDYTIYAEGINTNDTINLGGNDISFNNGTVFTSGDNQWLRIDNNDSFYNMVITKGDTTGEVVPYFEGMTSVENPKVRTPIVINGLLSTAQGKWESSSHFGGSVVYVPMIDVKVGQKYIIASSSRIPVAVWRSKTWVNNDVTQIEYADVLPDRPLIFTPDVSQVAIFMVVASYLTDKAHEVELRMYEGEVDYGYLGRVENPKAIIERSTVSYTDLKLRSLPNGVKDTINVVTGEYVQRVGEVVLDGSEDWVRSAHTNSMMFYTSLNNLVHKEDYLNSISCDKFVVYADEGTLHDSISLNGISGYVDWVDTYPNENWLYIKHADSESSVEKFKQWLKENPVTVQYELAEPITTKLDPQTLLAYTDGTINLSSETGFLPTTHYTVPSTNTFNLPSMKTGTRYTLKYPSASGSITIGDINYSISSDSMLFTTPLKINGDTSAIIFSDANPENVVLLEGAYNTREVPYFTGVKSVKNPNITIIDQLSTESTTYNCETEIELRGLPNGVADKLDIIKGKLTTNVGIRPYQEGDENLSNIWTDGYETVYALSSPVVTNVTIDHPTVTTNSLIELSSDYLIPQLNYRAPSSNNFPLDLLQSNTTYTLYADTLTSGSYILGGTRTGIYSQPHTITLGDITDNLLTFNGDLGLSNVMLVKGNSLKTTLPPYFLGIRSVTDGHLLVEGMAGEINELTFDEGIVLRDCNGVKDTIDLITCTLTKRTGEITLTGAEGWYRADNESTTDHNVFKLTLGGLKEALVMCDTLQSVFDTKMMDCIHAHTNELCIVIANATIGGDTVNALKSWLNQHPTTVVYQLRVPIEVQLENTWTTLPPTSYSNQTEISSTVSTNSLKPMISVTIATTTLEEIVSDLEAQNAQLEEENMATMLALTSVYETLAAPATVSTMSLDDEVSTVNLSDDKDGNNINGMSVSPIGMVYVNLIRKGLKTIEQVPYNLQPEVMYALRGME